MTEKKKEIVTLLKEAVNPEKSVHAEKRVNPRNIYIPLLLLFIIATAVSLYSYFDVKKKMDGLRSDMKQKITNSLDRAKQLEDEKKYHASKELYLSVLGLDNAADATINERIKALDRKIIRDKEVLAYTDRLELKDIRISNFHNELKVSGTIINRGSREVNDIALTLFCLDTDDRMVCEKEYISVSPDGYPLRKYQRRRFSITIDNAPDEAKGVQIIVSDIEFQE